MKTVSAQNPTESSLINPESSSQTEMVLSAEQKVTGLSLIASAMQKDNFNIEILERLVKLQSDMEEKDSIKAFNADFSKMMEEIPVIAKTGVNTYNGTQFAKLEDIVEITRPILSKYGFSVTYKQQQEMIAGAKTEPNSIFCYMTVTCVLKHRLGHEESNSILLPVSTIKGQTPIQAMGMGSTYGRRYTLMQALNIATAGADQDGQTSDFAQVASSGKKPIDDSRFNKALALYTAGKINLFSDLIDRYELTVEQKIKIEELNKKGE